MEDLEHKHEPVQTMEPLVQKTVAISDDESLDSDDEPVQKTKTPVQKNET